MGINPTYTYNMNFYNQGDELMQPQSLIIEAIETMLRPLIRLLLNQGITFPMLAERLRSIYVELASNELEGGRGPSHSAISLATGIHRKEVKRLLEVGPDEQSTPRTVTLGARLIGIWIGDPDYLDKDGQPLSLPRTTSDPGKPSFEQMVESVNRDVRPRSVLDDWLRLGLVDLNSNDEVVLRQQAFIPQQGEEEKIHFFGRNLHDHIAAGSHNLSTDQPPFLDRAVFYDGLSPESLAQLQQLSETQGMELLRSINQQALTLAKTDDNRSGAKGRMTLGLYYYQQITESEQESNR